MGGTDPARRNEAEGVRAQYPDRPDKAHPGAMSILDIIIDDLASKMDALEGAIAEAEQALEPVLHRGSPELAVATAATDAAPQPGPPTRLLEGLARLERHAERLDSATLQLRSVTVRVGL
jgi:hypothetical protein